jgi:hypothetical protein
MPSTPAPTLAAATLATLADDEPARRRALAAYHRAAPDRAAAIACAAGAHHPRTATAREEAVRAALGGVAPAVVLALVTAAHEQRHAREVRRGERIYYGDPLARRAPGNVPARAVRRELKRIYYLARLRAASHCHEVILTVGDPGASSDSGSVPSGQVGMSSAYCKTAYKVATSVHRIQADARLFSVPRAERVGHGWLRLTPDLLVRQSRGTSLVVERRPVRRQGRAA